MGSKKSDATMFRADADQSYQRARFADVLSGVFAYIAQQLFVEYGISGAGVAIEVSQVCHIFELGHLSLL